MGWRTSDRAAVPMGTVGAEMTQTHTPSSLDRPQPERSSGRPRRRTFRRGLLIAVVFASMGLALASGIASLIGDDPPSAEIVEIEFAEPVAEALARPADQADVERTLLSMLGPTDDVGATIAALGDFPALGDVVPDSEIVLVDHQVTVSSHTRLSVAFVTSAERGDALARIESAIESSGAPVVGPRFAVDSEAGFPAEARNRPPNRNRWVELAGVALDDGGSWIGISFHTRLEDVFPEPLWQSELASGDTIDIATSIQVASTRPGYPEPPDPFVGGRPAPAPIGDETATIVLVERFNTFGSPFEPIVERLERSDRWFADAVGRDIDVSETYADPVGAREWTDGDRHAQFITSNGASVDTVFNTLIYSRVTRPG